MPATWTSGTSVDARYRLDALLGSGTFGQVRSAADAKMDARIVAIKVLKPEFLTHADVVARFENEARALSRLQHPNVIALLDRGEWEGRRYIVFEFVDGRPLDAWLEAHRVAGRYPAPRIPSCGYSAAAAGSAPARVRAARGAWAARPISSTRRSASAARSDDTASAGRGS